MIGAGLWMRLKQRCLAVLRRCLGASSCRRLRCKTACFRETVVNYELDFSANDFVFRVK